MNNKKNNFIEYSDHNLNFKWKTDSLYDLVLSHSPALVSFKVYESAQLIFEIDTFGNIKNQSKISLNKIIKKMEGLLIKTNRAELIFKKQVDSFGVLKEQKLNNIIQLGKKKISKVTAYTVGILRENYSVSADQITLLCNIQIVSNERLDEIKALMHR